MSRHIITSKPKKLIPYLKEVNQFRNLLLTFARRDLKAIYAQTVLGVLWTALQPLTALIVFSVFFTLLSPVDTGDIPYPLFAFTGLVSWYFFTAMVVRCGTSVAEAQGIISDIYFPKLILPLSKSIVGLVEFGISLAILLVIMLVIGHYPGVQVLALPGFILMNLLLGLTVGTWLSALSYRYRDFQHIVPYLVNFGIWLTPVFYPATLIPGKVRLSPLSQSHGRGHRGLSMGLTGRTRSFSLVCGKFWGGGSAVCGRPLLFSADRNDYGGSDLASIGSFGDIPI